MLDSIGARDTGFGDDVPYDPEAWEQVERGERPLATRSPRRSSTSPASRSETARVTSTTASGRSSSCLDPLDPPLERLRAGLGAEPPRWGGARFAVALTHDVDSPWKWTRTGLKGAAARAKSDLVHGRVRSGLRELRGLAGAPLHKARGTDPFWSFDRILADERRSGASSTFFLMAEHAHELDGPAAEQYERLRPRLVETLLDGGAEVGLHGSYSAADDRRAALAAEKKSLEQLAGPVRGQRYHFLRLDPHRNLASARGRRLRLRLVARLQRRARLSRRDRAPVPALGLRARGAERHRRSAARRDGRDAFGRALPRPERAGRG